MQAELFLVPLSDVLCIYYLVVLMPYVMHVGTMLIEKFLECMCGIL